MIVYLIGNFKGSNTGHGGHYYSLREMFQAINRSEASAIFSLGQNSPPALDGVAGHVHIETGLIFQFSAIKKILFLLNSFEEAVTVVHAYDSNVAYVGEILAYFLKCPFVLTKCGGGKPRFFYPRTSSLVVFHEADYAYFNRKFPRSEIKLIANRVSRVCYDEARANGLFGEKKKLSFVRICRIGKAYKESIIQAMNLTTFLNDNGLDCQLKVIGFVEDAEIYEHLINNAPPNVDFYITAAATKNASRLLGYFDVVLGSGRGAMEALSLGKIVLFSIKGEKFPCLYNEFTSSYAEIENFSSRVLIPHELDAYRDPSYLLTYLRSSDSLHSLQKFALDSFSKKFDVDVGASKLMEFYSTLSRSSFLYLMRSLIPSKIYLIALGVVNAIR
ncbi:hypothetical protein NA645_00900 [Pseudomonas stutzeri]|uniref:hypothetical protein n=1 Tax=Stutzerimonas stutzeri TaxID=316 RepID=UPI00210C6CF4|nr:hypothetical protein [Stutzerimonas stutzeri]MCQ4306542.1 hypothetical protein [Stutzerimonas stutzeri]